MDDATLVQLNKDGGLVSVTFLNASAGVRLEGVPEAEELGLGALLSGYNVKVLEGSQTG